MDPHYEHKQKLRSHARTLVRHVNYRYRTLTDQVPLADLLFLRDRKLVPLRRLLLFT